MGYTFLYNPGVIKLRDLYAKGKCGDMYYMKATRTHLGLVRPDVDALWDLAPHDISIFNFIVSASPVSVSAVSGCYLKDGRADVAFLVLEYPGGVLGQIHVSWADSNKERRIDMVGSKARIVFDDLNALERVKIYEKGISAKMVGGDSYGEFLYALRDGAIMSPKISGAEPLIELCRAFLRSVRTRKEPVASLKHGVDGVQILEAADRSIARGGARVAIK
jgi:predicted dehydrogenase